MIINCILHFYKFEDSNEQEKLAGLLVFFYFLTVIVDIILLITSGIKLLKISKTMARSAQNKLDNEKRWFLTNLMMFLIFIMTWVAELFYWSSHDVSKTLISSLMLDLVKLFGAINIFIIIVVRDDVKNLLFKKYRSTDEDDTVEFNGF